MPTEQFSFSTLKRKPLQVPDLSMLLIRLVVSSWAAVQAEAHQSPRQPPGKHRSPPAVPAGIARFKRGHFEPV